MDEVTYKYLGFEMKRGKVDTKEMMSKLEQRIQEHIGGAQKKSGSLLSVGLDSVHQPEHQECCSVL